MFPEWEGMHPGWDVMLPEGGEEEGVGWEMKEFVKTRKVGHTTQMCHDS